MTKTALFISAILSLSLVVNCTDTEPEVELVLDPPILLEPTDGATISINPPTFVWHSVSGDSCDLVYRFELATDSTCVPNSIVISTMIPLPDTTYTPQDSFATGTYYWHMCVRQNA